MQPTCAADLCERGISAQSHRDQAQAEKRRCPWTGRGDTCKLPTVLTSPAPGARAGLLLSLPRPHGPQRQCLGGLSGSSLTPGQGVAILAAIQQNPFLKAGHQAHLRTACIGSCCHTQPDPRGIHLLLHDDVTAPARMQAPWPRPKQTPWPLNVGVFPDLKTTLPATNAAGSSEDRRLLCEL